MTTKTIQLKKKKNRVIKAWAVLVSKNQTDTGGKFLSFGNGRQNQYPIFPDREEALNWRNENRNTRGRIVPCQIKLLTGNRSAKKRAGKRWE